MTRANINFVYQNLGEQPTTLFHYENGDQYPSGMRDCFNIISFLKKPFTPSSFKEWIKKEYKTEAEDLGEGGQPKIYYTGGFTTDYSYVFDEDKNSNQVLVYNWAELIFSGTREKAIVWFKKQK